MSHHPLLTRAAAMLVAGSALLMLAACDPRPSTPPKPKAQVGQASSALAHDLSARIAVAVAPTAQDTTW